MEWYTYLALFSAFVCVGVFTYRLVYLLSLGMPKDLSQQIGSVKKGIIYSFTGAMSPTAKESAYLHLPTYTAGLLYHAGIFTSILFFVWVIISGFFAIDTPQFVNYALILLFSVSAIAGISILIKRFISPELKMLSIADDYISNILTTLAQIATVAYIYWAAAPFYYIVMTALFLWMPFGKTKHVLYFFFARIHLGFFYGRRNAWPTVRKNRI